MPLARLIAYLPLFCLLCMATTPSFAADNDQVAAELHKIIDSGEPVIGDQTNDDRIVEVYVFYAADRNYKPLWVRDNGPKTKAKDAPDVFRNAGNMGLNPNNYHVAELEKKMSVTTPRELAELELMLTRSFIDFGRDINRGVVLPNQESSENVITPTELGALTLIDGAEN